MLKREQFNRWYSTGAFFTAFIVIDLPITFLCSLCYVSITYVMTNQPLEVHRYLAFFCVSLALSYAAQGVGLMGSALLDVKVKDMKLGSDKKLISSPSFPCRVLQFSVEFFSHLSSHSHQLPFS